MADENYIQMLFVHRLEERRELLLLLLLLLVHHPVGDHGGGDAAVAAGDGDHRGERQRGEQDQRGAGQGHAPDASDARRRFVAGARCPTIGGA